MSNKYIQLPPNKEFVNLSNEQKKIHRVSEKIGDDKVCTCCYKSMPITDYYWKQKKIGRRSSHCKWCAAKKQGVLNIGIRTYAKKLLNNGLRQCSTCKENKTIILFSKSKNRIGGYSYNCKECSYNNSRKHQKLGVINISNAYAKQILISCKKEVTQENIRTTKISVIDKRQRK